MRLLFLLLLALTLQDARQPWEGEFAHVPGHTCWRQPDQEWQGHTYHHCECKIAFCDTENNPHQDAQSLCVTFCGTKQCVCHADEKCDMPGMEMPK